MYAFTCDTTTGHESTTSANVSGEAGPPTCQAVPYVAVVAFGVACGHVVISPANLIGECIKHGSDATDFGTVDADRPATVHAQYLTCPNS